MNKIQSNSKFLLNTTTYPTLLKQVRETLIDGQRRIERERVRTYWGTGRIILKDILKHKDRAKYGEEVVLRLAKDLNVDPSVLKRCIQFAKKYPHLPIGARGHQFSWSHYRRFITISDDKKRLSLEKSAAEKGWTAEELATRIHDEKSTDESQTTSEKPQTPSNKLLTPQRGIPYTYQIIKRPNVAAAEEPEFYLDLGFGNFQELSAADQAKFSDKTIVESRPREDKFKLFESKRAAKDLYTYRAVVEKVIDGDTLKVRFQLGFGQWHRETLRLRGLDCPEIDTKEGMAAKIFVQTYIKEAQIVTVRSSRSDKYDRYLADVFISTESDPDPQTDLYLNNLLLENNHAVRMD